MTYHEFGEVNPVVGKEINDMLVLGREIDTADHWVGADIEVRIAEVGDFFLTIVTKQWFLDEELANTLERLHNPDAFFASDETIGTQEEKPPYVLNDTELSEDILREKFIGRVVMHDLATSLWPIAPEE